LTSHFDSTLNFEFRTSFCQDLSVIVFDLCHLFCKKARLQGFIKKFITLEPLEINNSFFLVGGLKTWPIFSAISDYFLCFIRLQKFFKIANQKMSKTSFF
jgi:hypothetical protein